MTEVEQFQRFTRCIATMPPHVAETLAVFLEWQIEQIEEQERAAPGFPNAISERIQQEIGRRL
jgi:hypothetical protein